MFLYLSPLRPTALSPPLMAGDSYIVCSAKCKAGLLFYKQDESLSLCSITSLVNVCFICQVTTCSFGYRGSPGFSVSLQRCPYLNLPVPLSTASGMWEADKIAQKVKVPASKPADLTQGLTQGST